MGPSEPQLRLDRPVRFAGFVFDPRAGELASDTGVVRLGEKPAAALEALLAAPGAVIDRPTLCRQLWPDGTVVDYDNNLNAAIKKLRDALGDDAEAPKLIETLPRRGYRFVGAVEADVPTPTPTETGAHGGRRSVLAVRLAAVAAAVILAVLLALRLRSAPTAAGIGAEAAATAGPVRLAVLPFEALGEPSGTETPPGWLRDGLTEELITLLGRLEPSRLAVIARHSSMQLRGRQLDLEEVGRRLDVAWAIEGTVASLGAGTRVTVRLVRTDDASVVWSGRYEEPRGRVEELVRHVATGVGTALAERLLADDAGARLRGATVSNEAYEAFLAGRAAWHRFDGDAYLEARAAFERALALDPDFAPAHAALADAYNLLAFTDRLERSEALAAAEAAAREALARDPNLALAHNALAFARLYGRFDLGSALSHFARAVELEPNFAMAHHWRAGALAASGRVDEAVAAARRAVELDPLSLSVISDLGWYLIYADRFADAVALCTDTVERHAGYGWAASCLIEASRELGDLATAAAWLERRMAPTEAERSVRPAIAGDDPAAAVAAFDRLALDRLRTAPAPHALAVAEMHARLSERDAAFAWLERAFEARDPWLLFVPVQPFFDLLHGDPRLDDLARRIGLPAEVRRTLSSAPASG